MKVKGISWVVAALFAPPAIANDLCETTYVADDAKGREAEVRDWLSMGPLVLLKKPTSQFCSITIIDSIPTRTLHSTGEIEGIGLYRLTHDNVWTGLHIEDEAEETIFDSSKIPVTACRSPSAETVFCTFLPDGTDAIMVSGTYKDEDWDWRVDIDTGKLSNSGDPKDIDPRYKFIVDPAGKKTFQFPWQMHDDGTPYGLLEGEESTWFVSHLNTSSDVAIVYKRKDGEPGRYILPSLPSQKAIHLMRQLGIAQKNAAQSQ